MRSRSAACIVVLAGCFGDPPAVDTGTGTDATFTSSSTTTGTSGNTQQPGSESAEVSDGSETSIAATDTSDSTAGREDWCPTATLVSFEPFAPPDQCQTRFEGVARLGDMMWVAGVHASACSTAHPAVWPLRFDDMFDPPIELQLGQDYNLVAFLDDDPPLLIYNEGQVRAVAYDDPADMMLSQVGAWDLGTGSQDAFGDVVRTPSGLFAAATRTNMLGQPEWALITSDDGVAWAAEMFAYSLSPTAPAFPRAIAVGNDDFITMAGVATNDATVPHWVVFRFLYNAEPPAPVVLPGGSANAAVLVGGDIIVGGELMGAGEIQRAGGPDAEFVPFGTFAQPIIDLAAGPDGGIVALTGTPQEGFTLQACPFPEDGSSCWRVLAEAAPPAGDLLDTFSLYVEPDQIWVAGSHQDGAGGPSLGALFRAECDES